MLLSPSAISVERTQVLVSGEVSYAVDAALPVRRNKLASSQGMTLVEVLYALGLVCLFSLGLLGSMLYARRTSEYVVRQNVALELSQGYSEQIKNIPFADLVLSPALQADITANPGYYLVKTQKNELTNDYLTLSPGLPPALSAIDAATATCPNPRTVEVNPCNDRLLTMDMKLWVYINPPIAGSAGEVKMVTIIYAFKFTDTMKTKWYKGTIKSMKSVIPTF